MSRKAVCWMAAALAALALGACGGGSEPTQPNAGSTVEAEGADAGPGQTLTVATGSDSGNYDPHKIDDESNHIALWRVYEGLTGFDRENELVPVLAEELPTQVDDTTWEVAVAPDVTFADGTPLDADAVVYSIERILDPDTATAFSEVMTIKAVSKVDERTVRIETDGPDHLLPARLAAIRIVPVGAGEQKGFFAGPSNGTGPYSVVERERGESVTLEYNENYRGEEPQVTSVEIRYMPDDGTRVQALQAGEVDMVVPISPEQTGTVPSVVKTALPTAVLHARLNPEVAPLDQVDVRRAINLAVDKEGIAEQLYGGYAEPAQCQPIDPAGAPNGNTELEPYPYDPEQAKQLIEEAGATGAKVDLDWSTGVYPQDRAVGEAVAEYIKAVGLDVDLDLLELDGLYKSILANAEGPGMVVAEIDNPLGNADRAIDYWYRSGGPVSAFSDQQIDDAFEGARQEPDEETRNGLYRDALERICDQAASLFVVARHDLIGLAGNLGYSPYSQLVHKVYFDEVGVSEPQA